MSSILIYEWVTGGGLFQYQEHNCLVEQARSMLRPLVLDFSRASMGVTLVGNPHLEGPCIWNVAPSPIDKFDQLRQLASEATYIMLIAPESKDCLRNLCHELEEFESKLISPNFGFVDVASDKTRTCEILATAGIPVPNGNRLDRWQSENESSAFPLPCVIKPNVGEGSVGNHYLESPNKGSSLPADSRNWRIEKWFDGHPTSVAVLLGIRDIEILPPMFQMLDEPAGEWTQSVRIEDVELASRATQLAKRVCDAMPEALGYIGIDLILGNQPNEDTVVEVNPRLTSSYAALRDCVDFNIAERILELQI